MAERPLLILPSPTEPVRRRNKGGGPGKFSRPNRQRQGERLDAKFELLQRAFEERRALLRIESHGVVPEDVIVLETIGTVDGFLRAVEKVSGMEWLTEVDREGIPPDDDFFAVSSSGKAKPGYALRGRLFVIFANHEALQQMLSLWQDWKSERELPFGLRKWKSVFANLKDVRRWSVRDRLYETGVLEDWHERVDHGQEIVPCEIEIWYRKTPHQRQLARDRIVGLVETEGGRVASEALMPEISYQALLVDLPIGAVGRVLEETEKDVELVQCEQIQFFRATGQMTATVPEAGHQTDDGKTREEQPSGVPVIALFDGLPLQAHRRLQGRMIVDDPDEYEEDYPAGIRRHGTSMASLIIHGDLEMGDEPLPRRIYVRPILRPDPRDWRESSETVAERTFVVDLIHRAVRRLFEGDGDEAAVAPNVAVINLSIGIRDRPFEHSLSPLARLLDWLSWRYRVLFVVSAGNHASPIELSIMRDDFSSVDAKKLQEYVIQSVAADSRHRRLLSPAEAVNAMTVASIHGDTSTGQPPRWRDPYVDGGLPSPINAHGMGYRRSIKPEVLESGGRVVVQECLASTDGFELEVYDGRLAPGQLVASPGSTVGAQGAVQYSRGTSNAAALVSRSAGWLYEVLDELRGELGGEIIDAVPRSVWIKALIAHAADWGATEPILRGILGSGRNVDEYKEYVTRLIGYGVLDIDRVRECTKLRATAISGGMLQEDEAHVHRVPLPDSLSGKRGHRRLIVSLAWLSPVNPRHQAWRRADLWFSPRMEVLRVKRQQADWQAVRRGTVQHEILEGDSAGVYVAGSDLEIQVSCRADAGELDESVPYAIVTTLEVAPEIGIDIYDEIRTSVRARVEVTAGL